MTNRSNITTRRIAEYRFDWALSCSWLRRGCRHSHMGGFEHVRGTVVKVANNVLTIKRAKGNVDVKLDSKTELTRDDQKAQLVDLKPGTRVVVDLHEGGKDPTAHSVKIGTLTKTVAEHRPRK